MQWRGPKSLAAIESEREINGKSSRKQRLYSSGSSHEATRIATTIRAHWSVKSHNWCMDLAFNDDRRSHPRRVLCAQLGHSEAHYQELDPHKPGKRKGGIKARRRIAATSNN
jgi:hypothetical protein